jgi:hypothetical protein
MRQCSLIERHARSTMEKNTQTQTQCSLIERHARLTMQTTMRVQQARITKIVHAHVVRT